MTTFYVSPSGNDGSSGLSATASGSNGPFATIARALQAMRASSGSDVLYIEGGTYAQGTINLTSADSGDSFQAYQGQQAVISGGTAVTGWTVGSNGVWQAHVSLSDVEQLVVNGVPQTDARFPNSVPSNPIDGGWLWAQTLPGGDNPSLQMAYNKSDFPAGMQPTAGEKVTVFAQWGYSSDVLTISSVNTSAGVITFDQPASNGIGPGSRYYISGGQPLLDQTGEYYFDQSSGTLYYKPPAGFDGSNAVAAGGDSTLVNISNASNITLKGLTFANAATTAQTDDVKTAAVVLNSATGVTVDTSTFSNVAQGVLIGGTSSGDTVSNDAFQYIGSSAVALNARTHNNTITNNSITQSNYEFASAGAIQMWNSAANTISNNLIENVPRFGIAENNYDPSIAAGGNTIQNNVIINSGQTTPDVGAIYVYAQDDPGAAGDIIRNNNIQNVGGPLTDASGFNGKNMSWGIYLDNLVSNTQIYGNFVSGTTNSGVFMHGGNNNTVYDNVLVNSQDFGLELQTVGSNSMTGTKIYDNVMQIPSDGNVAISMDTSTVNPSQIHNNIYVTATGAVPNYNPTTWSQFQKMGGDSGSSVVTSAGFVNAAQGNYSFAAGSVALNDGIPQLLWNQMGPTGTPGAPGGTIGGSSGTAADTTPPSTQPASLTVAENAAATAIGIAGPTDPNYATASLTVTATGLPTNGTVYIAGGSAVTSGESLTVAQLTGLQFLAAPGASGDSSTFTYSVGDPAGLSATGSASLSIGAGTTPPTGTPSSTVTPATGLGTYNLPDDQYNNFTLTNGNFKGVSSKTITVNGGDDGNMISGAALSGSNRLVAVGGSGNDILVANSNMTMTGGGGADEFVISEEGTTRNPNKNTITDFTHGTDKIVLSDMGFALGADDGKGTATPQAILSSLLSPNTNGTFATTANRLAYNSGTGQLYFDADGSGSGHSATLLATLTNHSALSASDLFFIQ